MSDDKSTSAGKAVHRYTARCSWNGSTGAGYEKYGRAHSARAEPAEAELALSSDRAFLGDPALLNPEQLVVMAASSCQLLSFLAVSARSRMDIVSYEDHAEGEMSEAVRPMRIGKIVLKPHIVLAAAQGTAPDEGRVLRAVELAHRECFIANSLNTEITVEPTIEWR